MSNTKDLWCEMSAMPINKDPSKEMNLKFVPKHNSLAEVLIDHELAALGDAYVNLVYSLALSSQRDKPVGKKTEGGILASALRKAGLRRLLPSRTDRHKQADAAEALIAYAWLTGNFSLGETVNILSGEETIEDRFALLLKEAAENVWVPYFIKTLYYINRMMRGSGITWTIPIFPFLKESL